jgi:hypothetical protein
MNQRRSLLANFLALSILMCGCDLGQSSNSDPQFLKLEFKYFFRNNVDTFNGTLTKDLAADGTITIPFWLTTGEQDSILAEVVRSDFYGLPDTLRGNPAIRLEPDPGPQILKIEVDGRLHQVVWYMTSGSQQIVRLSQFIQDIVQAKPEYKSLPPARGGYL